MKNGPLLGDLFKMGKVIYQVHLQRNSTVPKDFTLDAALIHRLLQAAPNPTKEDYPTVESDIPFELVQPDLKAPKNVAPIPASKMNRLFRYVGLATGLTTQALQEQVKRSTGFSSKRGSLLYTPQAIKTLVETLTKMRGAALKLGQMLSIQDNELLPPEILEVFDKVRNSAYFMPQWQLETVLVEAFGDDWQSLFRQFDKIPIAAASIGQVHKATILDLETQKEISVAVKIQYPGVAQSIQSDITNLKLLLNFGNFLPKGLFLENTLKVMKKELEWETDFLREAHWTSWFKENLVGTQRDKKFEESLGIFDFTVPKVYKTLTTTRILTTDFKQGIPINEAIRYPQHIRDRLGTSILYLCLKELFLLKAMQTDPNWTNFLFDYSTQTLVLLDFGAAREFNTDFVILYQKLVQAAALQDRDRCRNLSIQLGFLTGDETQVMTNIHIDSMIILGLPFRSETLYDFSKHAEITKNIKNNIPKMLQDRLCPPPEDSYSLHRKLSGAFLLCSKLGAKVPCQVLLKHFSPS